MPGGQLFQGVVPSRLRRSLESLGGRSAFSGGRRVPSARPTGRRPPCAASRHHPPAAPPLRGCVLHPCPRTFARPALTIHMLGLGTSGAAGPAQLPEFSLSGPRTRLWPLPSDRGHAPSAQDDVVTSRAPPGPGAPWEWGPEPSHPQACGQGASCLAPRCGVPPSASTPGPPTTHAAQGVASTKPGPRTL